MKTKSLIILFTLIISTHAFSQRSAYYDALYLSKQVHEDSTIRRTPQNIELFNYYFGKNISDDSLSKLLGANPFLKDFYNENVTQGTFTETIKSIFSNISGFDVTNIATGVAMLMIDRAKQELTITFFNRFKKFVEKNPEFQVLFPKTTDNLNNLLSYKYPEMLPALRTGFFEDLTKITYHLDDVLELPRYKELLKNFAEIRVCIRSIRLVHQIESGESQAADVINTFAEFKEWNQGNSNNFKNFGSSVKLAAIFSNSLRYVPQAELSTKTDTIIKKDTSIFVKKLVSKETVSENGISRVRNVTEIQTSKTFKLNNAAGDTTLSDTTKTISYSAKEAHSSQQMWIDFGDLKKLITDDKIAFKIYLGLIYQEVKMKNISWYVNNEDLPFTKVMKDQRDNLFLFENKVTEFVELANNVDKILDTLKDKKQNNTTLTNDDYYRYINASMDVIEYGFTIAQLFNRNLNISEYTAIARKSNDLYRHIYKKEYTSAVTNGLDILSSVYELVSKSNNLNVSAYKDSLYYLPVFIVKGTKYALFVANMAQADSPEEVKAVLDNAILPVGSSSIKKNSNFNFSVQSYLGAHWNTSSTNKLNNTSWNDRFSVSAPIGLSVSYGLNNGPRRNIGSVSLFASLFDLGAIVDYQLKKDSVVNADGTETQRISKGYKIELGQIFSPGAYIVYGFFGNIPLSLGFGAQYGPGLSKIETTGNTVINNPSWRWNAFLSVDIPFFTLSNKAKNYKFKK